MITIPCPDFSLEHTLMSGQAFRWHRHGDGFRGIVQGSVLSVSQEGETLRCESADASWDASAVRRYFGLDQDLAAILRSIDVDAQIHAAIGRFRGLRVLRQDGWETLASFICSSFNNIKRIEGMMDRLCQAFGDPVELRGFRSFAFPRPEAIAGAGERRLRALGLGYRAAYLRSTARRVADGRLRLEQLRQIEYGGVKAALLACDGVGDKVADCAALFGCGKLESFPVDVWMERVMRYYFRHRRMTRGLLHRYAAQHFGAYAGVAQQYLFHYARTASRWPEPARMTPGVQRVFSVPPVLESGVAVVGV